MWPGNFFLRILSTSSKVALWVLAVCRKFSLISIKIPRKKQCVVNSTVKMKALKCKPSAQFAYNYSINVLSKYSNIISHRSRPSKVDTSITDLQRSTHRSSRVDTVIINLRGSTPIIDPRRLTHRSSKADTSIIDLERSTYRSSKVDTHQSLKVVTSIFEDRRQKYCTDNPTSHRQLITKYRSNLRSTVFK